MAEPMAAPWLNFISTLIWQLMVATILFYFRGQIAALVVRLASVRVGETELSFQVSSPKATKPGGQASKAIEMLGPAGFFTREGIGQLVAQSGLVNAGEEVVEDLLLFRTSKQRTWLVLTNRQLFCLLDDADTRASERLIQWRLLLEEADPVEAKVWKPALGLLGVGQHTDWIYSRSLHSDPHALEEAVRTMIERAKVSS